MISFSRGVSIICLVAALIRPLPGQDSLPDRYHRYQGVLDTLEQLQNLFPSILYLDTLGYSTRDSIPMLRLKISDNPRFDEDEPAVFFCSGVHADEVLGPEVTFNFIEDIVYRWADCDSEAVNYINNLEIFVVPFINPEGRLVVEDGDLDWRKNKSDNDTNGVFDNYDGVDNNRNYDIGWQYLNGDNSAIPSNLLFRGYAPFTESENIAMREFGFKYKPVIAVDYHSPTYGRGEVVYYPWSWSGHGHCPDYNLIENIAYEFSCRIHKIHGVGNYDYIYGHVNKGDFKNFFYGHYGTIPMTVEISDTTIEDPALADSIVAAHLPGQYYLLSRALGPGISGIIRDSLTLEPLEAEVEVSGLISNDIYPRLSRADFGRYRRLLAPGVYILYFIKDGYLTKIVYSVAVGNNGYTEVDVLLVPENPCPPAPTLLHPTAGQTLYDRDVIFSWSRSDYDEGYMLEVAIDPDFDNDIIYVCPIVDNEYESVLPSAGESYYWRVKSYNPNGWGPFSPGLRFFIDFGAGIDADDNLPENFMLLQNDPNPFNTRTSFSFFAPAESPVRLLIYDITGALAAVPVNRIFDAGWHVITWNGQDIKGNDLASGVYFYILQTPTGSLAKRLTILK